MKNLFVDYELPKPLSDEELKYYMKEIAKGNPGTGVDHALFPVRKADGRTGTDEKS